MDLPGQTNVSATALFNVVFSQHSLVSTYYLFKVFGSYTHRCQCRLLALYSVITHGRLIGLLVWCRNHTRVCHGQGKCPARLVTDSDCASPLQPLVVPAMPLITPSGPSSGRSRPQKRRAESPAPSPSHLLFCCSTVERVCPGATVQDLTRNRKTLASQAKCTLADKMSLSWYGARRKDRNRKMLSTELTMSSSVHGRVRVTAQWGGQLSCTRLTWI